MPNWQGLEPLRGSPGLVSQFGLVAVVVTSEEGGDIGKPTPQEAVSIQPESL